MSDDFDKEAEREKLREKLERDREKRQHTQRMSELLLKGATMTNRHCDDCGDPIFRHDGQEFCPSCAAPGADSAAATRSGSGTGGAADDGAGTAVGDGTGAPAAEDGAGSGTGPASAVPGGKPASDRPSADRSPPSRSGSVPEQAPDPTPRSDSRPSQGDRHRAGEPAAREPDGPQPTPSTSAPGAGLADARASLERTVTKYARAAEESDDPRRTREYLAAAREAAETLSALE